MWNNLMQMLYNGEIPDFSNLRRKTKIGPEIK